MKLISEEDMETFKRERELDNKAREAKDAWLEQVEKSHRGEIEYEETRPLFDECIKLHDEWQKFCSENSEVLYFKAVK